jgi:hypothetical protein
VEEKTIVKPRHTQVGCLQNKIIMIEVLMSGVDLDIIIASLTKSLDEAHNELTVCPEKWKPLVKQTIGELNTLINHLNSHKL